MSTQTLSSVAIDVATQYHQASQHLVIAYHGGLQRAIDAASERFAADVQRIASPWSSDDVKSSLIAAQQQLAGLAAAQLDAAAERIAAINDRLAGDVKNGIERWASQPAQIGSTAADALATLNLPSAQLSLSVASAVAEGAKRLSERVAGATEDGIAVIDEVVPAKRAKRS